MSSLSKPRDAKRRSSGQIFLSYPHTHDKFLYSNTNLHLSVSSSDSIILLYGRTHSPYLALSIKDDEHFFTKNKILSK